MKKIILLVILSTIITAGAMIGISAVEAQKNIMAKQATILNTIE